MYEHPEFAMTHGAADDVTGMAALTVAPIGMAGLKNGEVIHYTREQLQEEADRAYKGKVWDKYELSEYLATLEIVPGLLGYVDEAGKKKLTSKVQKRVDAIVERQVELGPQLKEVEKLLGVQAANNFLKKEIGVRRPIPAGTTVELRVLKSDVKPVDRPVKEATLNER